jgi:hypothetical protein
MLEAESTPGPQCDQKDFMLIKNPLTPAGIEPATFQFVAQSLNHCALYLMAGFVARAFHVANVKINTS